MTGDLPPSSSETSAKFSALVRMTCRAVSRSPVKLTRVHRQVTGQCAAAELTMASHYIENPGGKPSSSKTLANSHGADVFRSFQHQYLRQVRGRFSRRREQLGIPGHHSYHAERLTDGHRHHVRLVDRQGFPSDLVGQAGIVLKEVEM